MQYSKGKILKALFLAPLPILFFTALLFIIMNREYSLYSIFMVLVAHTLVYLAYCILTVPFSFTFSVFLNRYSLLNVLTICMGTLATALPFFMLLEWGHTGKIAQQWWMMYTNIAAMLTVLFPGLCYWLFLISLKDNKSKSVEQDV